MALIKFLTSSHYSTDFNVIQHFLNADGIQMGRFELSPLALKFQHQDTLDDEERNQLIHSFPQLEGQYSVLDGYRADVVCLYPAFEHLQWVLKKFGDIHFHYENEFWYFIDGSFDFIFLNHKGSKYQVTVNAGEYLQVPEGKWQYFYGNEHSRMKAIRFFYTTHQFQDPMTTETDFQVLEET